jgi:hypothetical protein
MEIQAGWGQGPGPKREEEMGGEKNDVLTSIIIWTHYYDDHIRKDEIGVEYTTHGRGEKCM